MTCCFIISAGIYLYMTRTCREISCISFPGISTWQRKDVYEQTSNSYRAIYAKDNEFMRVERYGGLNPNDADSLTKAKVMQIDGLLETAVSPYPGLLSNRITCDNRYLPTPAAFTATNTTGTSFIGYLNNRLQYGSCIDDQIMYTSYVALFYCKSHNSWYQLEHIVPRNSAVSDQSQIDAFTRITCKNRFESL